MREDLKRRGAPWKAKLSEAQVIEIRKAYANGATKHALAKQAKVGWVTIRDIVEGKTWKHLLPPDPADEKPLPSS